MDNPRLVSVVIPAYNYARFLPSAIESVLSQGYRPFEVIVVDDGSTDETPQVVRRYAGRIRYIRQENRGLSGARNTGIRASRGNFIAFLDADDRWLPSKLERQREVLEKHPGTGIVGCGYHLMDEDGNVLETVRGRNYPRRQALLRDLIVWNVVTGSGSGAVVRRECFDQVGCFDDRLRSTEDRDMWYRIARRYGVRCVEAPLVCIRSHGASMSRNVGGMKRGQRMFLRKYAGELSPAEERRAYAYVYLDAAREHYRASRRIFAAANAILAVLRHPARIIEDDDKLAILGAAVTPGFVRGAIKKAVLAVRRRTAAAQ